MTMKDLHAAIRSVGGIVHSDGNIFFTNAAKFRAVAELALAASAHPAQGEQAAPPTDEQIDAATATERDALLDFIYEHGTTSEGVQSLVRKLVRAAYGIVSQGGR